MNKRFLCYFSLSVVWMTVIFGFSNQPGNDSAALSDRIVALLDFIFTKQEFLIAHASYLIRKGAHMSEYAILAIVYYLMLKETRYQNKAFLLAFMGSVFYAGSDEFHQLFVEGRAGLFQDVIIDGCGAMLGLGMIKLMKGFHTHMHGKVMS